MPLSNRRTFCCATSLTGALDYETGKVVLGAIARANEQLGTTTIIITHNAAIAGMADRVLRLWRARRRRGVNRRVGVDGPRRHRMCQNEVVSDLTERGPSMEQISRIGMDTSKRFFQLHGVNAAETVVLRKKLRRKEMVTFFEKLAPTVVGIEACGASHHWARLLRSFGHTVKLIPAQLVKPYVKRGKNDMADAEALCEAMSRPTMRFVPTKGPLINN